METMLKMMPLANRYLGTRDILSVILLTEQNDPEIITANDKQRYREAGKAS